MQRRGSDAQPEKVRSAEMGGERWHVASAQASEREPVALRELRAERKANERGGGWLHSKELEARGRNGERA